MSALGSNLQWNDIEIGRFPKLEEYYEQNHMLGKHSVAEEVKKIVGESIWNEYFTFSFVRHPYSRAISLYTYIQRMLRNKYSKNRFPFWKKRDNTPFWSWSVTKAFLESKNFSEFIRNENFLKYPGAQPQVNWVLDSKNEPLVDFIGKYENLAIDFEKVTKKVSGKRIELKSVNISTGKSSPSSYLREEADYNYLAELYKRDFIAFNYDPSLRFQNVATRVAA